MRRKRPPRSTSQRLALITAALGTLVLGYYLGNRFQYDELRQSSAIVLEKPVPVDIKLLPPGLRTIAEDPGQWVILLPGEPGRACDDLLDHYVRVINRLAAWPAVQSRIRLSLLNFSGRAPGTAWQRYGWARSYPLSKAEVLELTSQLGIAPVGNRWCLDVQATTALLGPGAEVRALLPLDKPAEMAESLRLLLHAMDPDV